MGIFGKRLSAKIHFLLGNIPQLCGLQPTTGQSWRRFVGFWNTADCEMPGLPRVQPDSGHNQPLSLNHGLSSGRFLVRMANGIGPAAPIPIN